jgi:hypothetical protein
MLQVIDAALPGDFNCNGIVDAADYVVWRKVLRTISTQTDYNTWRTHFGQTAGSGFSSSNSVPEPTTLVLLMSTAVSLCLRLPRNTLRVSKTH